MELREQIEKAWDNREMLKTPETQQAIREVISQLDEGKIRVANPGNGGWTVNEWIKKAVILYFPIQQMQVMNAGPMEFHDKIEVLWILERVEQLNDPSGIRFSKNVAFCSHMSQLCRGELVFAIIILYSVPDPSLTSPPSSKFSWHKFSLYLSSARVAPLHKYRPIFVFKMRVYTPHRTRPCQ